MELQPEELLLAALLRRAIKDAQGKQERAREEAARWLWTVAPGIAQRAEVPTPTTSNSQVQRAAFVGFGMSVSARDCQAAMAQRVAHQHDVGPTVEGVAGVAVAQPMG